MLSRKSNCADKNIVWFMCCCNWILITHSTILLTDGISAVASCDGKGSVGFRNRRDITDYPKFREVIKFKYRVDDMSFIENTVKRKIFKCGIGHFIRPRGLMLFIYTFLLYIC